MDTKDPPNILSGMIKFAAAMGLLLGSLGSMAQERAPDAVFLADGQVVVGEIVDEIPERVKVLSHDSEQVLPRSTIALIHYSGEELPVGPRSLPVLGPGLDRADQVWYARSMDASAASFRNLTQDPDAHAQRGRGVDG